MTTVGTAGWDARRSYAKPAAAADVATAHQRSVDDVFAALGAAVHGYVRASGAADSENLLGDVFLRVAKGLPRFVGDDGDLRRWVFTIAHHCVIDERRRVTRERSFLRVLRKRSASQDEQAQAPDDPFDPALVAALAGLTADQREVVTLRFVGDLTIDEVARITDRPPGAVKSLQHRALRNLAGFLTELDAARRSTPTR